VPFWERTYLSFETKLLWGSENQGQSQVREPGDTCNSIRLGDSHKRQKRWEGSDLDPLKFKQWGIWAGGPAFCPKEMLHHLRITVEAENSWLMASRLLSLWCCLPAVCGLLLRALSPDPAEN
jgi:hypothetical protein